MIDVRADILKFTKAKGAVHVCNIRTVCHVNCVSCRECSLCFWWCRIFKFEGKNVPIDKIIGFNIVLNIL